MLVLQLTAIALLFLAAVLFFGPQIIAYGPKSLPAMARNGQVRYVAGFLVSAGALTVFAPHFGTLVLENGEAVMAIALYVSGMDFGLA